MTGTARDLRLALRALRRSPGASFGAVVTLSLGVAAATVVFSSIHPNLIQQLAPGLVLVWETYEPRGWRTVPTSPLRVEDWRREQTVFEEIAVYLPWHFNVLVDGTPRYVKGARVTPEWGQVILEGPHTGRIFEDADLAEGAPPVVLISDLFWEKQMGGRPDVVGSTLRVDGVDREVVGVIRRETGYGRELHELWVPDRRFLSAPRTTRHVNAVARLRPGVTIEEAEAQITAIQLRLGERYPESDEGWGIHVTPLQDWLVGYFRVGLLLVFAASLIVVLVACANVSHLMLARNAAREGELAVRAAVGATRGCLVRQLLFESLVLGALAGLLGLWIASWVVEWELALLPSHMAWRAEVVRMTPPVVFFCLACGLASGLVAGLAPALAVARGHLPTSLRIGAGTTTVDPSRRRLRHALSGAQVAVAFAVLVVAGMLVSEYRSVSARSPGFETHDRVAFTVRRPLSTWDDPQETRRFYRALLGELRGDPEIASAAAVNFLPLSALPWSTDLNFTGVERPEESRHAQYRVVTHDYFETLGVPVLAGRSFGERDRHDAPCVVAVNAAARELFWAGATPVGETARTRAGPRCEVVAVVGDVRHFGLGNAASPEVYFLHDQDPQAAMTLVIETRLPIEAVALRLREHVDRVDPEQSFENPQSLDRLAGDSVWMTRYGAAVVSAYALVAVALAAVGAYAGLRVAVSQRTHEMGIRTALGAPPRRVRSLLLRQGLTVAGLGLLAGLPLAFVVETARGWAPTLVSDAPERPLLAVCTAALLFVAAVALVACWLPARRAARIRPMDALRYE